MTVSTRIGILFVVIAAIVGVGAVALTEANAGIISPRPVMLDVLGLAWMFLLWGGLVTISVFLIAWVAEAFSAEEELLARRQDHRATMKDSAPTSHPSVAA